MNYNNDIIEKLDKIQLAFEQTTLIINSKIDNYCTDNKIATDIKSIIKEHHDEYNSNILKEIIKLIKIERLTKVPNIPKTPPPKYEFTPIMIQPSAPSYEQINIIPSAPTYNQVCYIPPVTYASQPMYKPVITNNKSLLDKESTYTTKVLPPSPKSNMRKKKQNCIIT